MCGRVEGGLGVAGRWRAMVVEEGDFKLLRVEVVSASCIHLGHSLPVAGICRPSPIHPITLSLLHHCIGSTGFQQPASKEPSIAAPVTKEEEDASQQLAVQCRVSVQTHVSRISRLR